MNLHTLLKKHQHNFHPLFTPDLTPENTLLMDFSIHNGEVKKIDFRNVAQLNSFVFSSIESNGKSYGYGGYLEDREVYRRSSVFDTIAGGSRSIHLGTDVWTPAGKPVHSPLDARVHSFNNNDNYGDYGPTIILAHQLENVEFFTLYGHLTLESLHGVRQGMQLKKGDKFCEVGDFPVNGDWPPHLHFQVIADMKGQKGDFFGVSSKEEIDAFKNLCPDPSVFFTRLQQAL